MCVREESSTRKYYRNNINSGAVFISVGRAPAPCVEAIVLTAGGPDSKHASSGPILRFKHNDPADGAFGDLHQIHPRKGRGKRWGGSGQEGEG